MTLTENVAEATVIEPEFYGFGIDDTTFGETVIGLKILSHDGQHIVIPMAVDTAHDVGSWMVAHALFLRNRDED